MYNYRWDSMLIFLLLSKQIHSGYNDNNFREIYTDVAQTIMVQHCIVFIQTPFEWKIITCVPYLYETTSFNARYEFMET